MEKSAQAKQKEELISMEELIHYFPSVGKCPA